MPNVHWIVQYDPPTEVTEYVHRIGRTARRGRAGSALLMLRPCEAGYVRLLHDTLRVEMIELSRNALIDGLCESHHGRRGSSRRIEMAIRMQSQLQTLVERVVDSSLDLQTMAGDAFHKSVRAYACHSKDSKPMFNIRRLHLGHVAKSFGLKNPPSKIKRSERSKTRGGKGKSRGGGPGATTSTKRSSKEDDITNNIRPIGLDKNSQKWTSTKKAKFAESEFGS